MPSPTCLALVSLPKIDAAAMSRGLIRERLAACVSIGPNQTSVYRWHGKIETAREVLLMAKTKKSLQREFLSFVKKHHSYTTPEILFISIQSGFRPYLQWIEKETKE